MRRLTPPIICLVVLFATGYSGHGEAQSRRKTSKATPTTRPRPTPEPDSLEGLPPLKPTPTPKPDDNVLDLLPDETPEPPSEWELILFQDESSYSYNTHRITRLTPGVVKVWIKWTLYGEKRKKYISEMRESSHDYSKYFYSLQLEEYDCKGFRRRLLKAVDYNLLDEFIYSTDMKGEWTDVVPESVGEAVLEAVCHQKK